MGKLRFTLSYVLLWMILVFFCLVVENFNFFSVHKVGDATLASVFIVSFAVIALLIFYYYLEHKKNGLKFDKVLLPILVVFTIVSIATIWWQQPRTFINEAGDHQVAINITATQKFAYTLQVIAWAGAMYLLLFVMNRYLLVKKVSKVFAFIIVVGVFIASVIDIFMENKIIVNIFKNDYPGEGIKFLLYNSNAWGHMLLVALLSCIVLNVKKFNVFYYLAMLFFFIMCIFTTCATVVFVGAAAVTAYTLFEIISHFKKHPIMTSIILVGTLVFIGAMAGLFALLVNMKVSPFTELAAYIDYRILHKDFTTLTTRTGIWKDLWTLLLQRPVDLIFGLGYRTGNLTFTAYFNAQRGFDIYSAHNAMLEVVLRHGLIGLIGYATLFLVFVVGVIKLFIKKQFRMPCFYSIVFICLLGHSITESTMFVPGNTSSIYVTLVVFLPIATVLQEKKTEELQNELQQVEIQESKPTHKDVIYAIQLAIFGLMMIFGIALLLNVVRENIALLVSFIVVTVVSLFAYFLVPIIYLDLIKKEKISFKGTFLLPLKENILAIFLAGVSELVVLFVIQQTLVFDIITCLVMVLFFVAVYAIVVISLTKKDKAVTNYLNNFLLGRIKKNNTEVQNG